MASSLDTLDTNEFNIQNFQSEIKLLEEYNETHDVPRIVLPEGQESDI